MKETIETINEADILYTVYKEYNFENILILEQFFIEKKLHRDLGPAQIRYYETGELYLEVFFQENKFKSLYTEYDFYKYSRDGILIEVKKYTYENIEELNKKKELKKYQITNIRSIYYVDEYETIVKTKSEYLTKSKKSAFKKGKVISNVSKSFNTVFDNTKKSYAKLEITESLF